MKNLPMLAATVLGILAVILSCISLSVGMESMQANNTRQTTRNAAKKAGQVEKNKRMAATNASQAESNALQMELIKKQTEIQDLTQAVTLQNQEYQRQGEIINTGANIGQKVIQPILVEMGYVAAKKKNKKFEEMLIEEKFERAIPSKAELDKIDTLIEQNQAKQGAARPAPGSAPATSGASALRP